MSQSQAQASCGPAHPAYPAASRHQENDAGTKQRPAGVHHVLRQSSPKQRFVLFGNALDPRGRSKLLRLNAKLDIEASAEILGPADLPEPAYPLVRGFEDARLFAWRDAL